MRGRNRLGVVGLAAVAVLAGAVRGAPAGGQERLAGPDPCRAARAARPTAPETLERAAQAVGSRPSDPLRFAWVERQVQDYQSDRSYPPYFAAYQIHETVYDPELAAEHHESRLLYPQLGPTPARRTSGTSTGAFMLQGEGLVPVPPAFESLTRARMLNPWAVLADWSRTGEGVSLAGECRYRDEWRVVVEREGTNGAERLYLDRDSGFPVKLERTVPHATWGQLREEYLWSTWVAVEEGRFFPSASFRLADGRVVTERTVGEIGLVGRNTTDLPPLPDAAGMEPDPWLERWTAEAPDTVRVADDAYVLTHPAYNGLLVGVGDTVYVMDATLSEARARQDSAWARRLFPEHRAVKLIVTDVAWPHVGGVRFWVARGATVVTHAASEPFLRALVERRWTFRPDALDRARGERPLDLITVDEDGLRLADGAVQVLPVGGIGGEGALMAWVPAHALLWAGDYVQSIDGPTLYAGEVLAAAEREEIRPSHVVAQHLPLTAWSVVEGANGR